MSSFEKRNILVNVGYFFVTVLAAFNTASIVWFAVTLAVLGVADVKLAKPLQVRKLEKKALSIVSLLQTLNLACYGFIWGNSGDWRFLIVALIASILIGALSYLRMRGSKISSWI